MLIKVFAGLKDYFEPSFEFSEKIKTIEELRNELCTIQPASKTLLSKCRFAVQGTFVSDHFEVSDTQEILIMPPSSGG